MFRFSKGDQYFPGDERFLVGVKEAQLAEATPRATWALYLMFIVVLTACVWSAFAHVDEVARAEGRVVPDGREQVIASLEGGILRTMFVKEGMLVEVGQDLLQLDPTRFEAQQNEGHAKQIALKATIARLEAEAGNQPLVFPDEVTETPGVVESETQAYQARRQALDEAVGVSRRSLQLLNNELGMSERLAAKGMLSEVEVMRLRRQANDMTLQIQERINRFRQDATAELVKAQTELAGLEEQQIARRDVVRRTTIKSPVRGMVKNIRMGTLGGVVQPGAAILEIVPVGKRMLVEAKVKPADMGFIKIGLPAEVKLNAYDYYTYGGIKGVIEYISPDTLGDDKDKNTPQDTSYYRVLVRADQSTLQAGGKSIAVMPGMTASIEMRTGERTVLEYMLKPMMKSREAFRER
ncbi:HlyD family type I secretion periplasmic adaptor subunit [Aquabacterium sp.]|uniref:HlyD family type I secretion periplasmic adaptor subunit n=1 Tax=Aquabacterium sp. TaxID=1872578 RepID=UPI0035B044F5